MTKRRRPEEIQAKRGFESVKACDGDEEQQEDEGQGKEIAETPPGVF